MNPKGHETLIDISKHLITLSVAITAGLVTFITSSDAKLIQMYSAKTAIIASAIAVVGAILIQVSITSREMEEKNRIHDNPKIYYSISWLAFLVSGLFGGAFLLCNI